MIGRAMFLKRLLQACLPPTHAGNTAAWIPLPDHALLSLHGSDSTAFLHAQGSAAVGNTPSGKAQPISFADPKGRVLALAQAWRSATAWRLILPSNEVDWLTTHLKRHRFRSQVEFLPDPLIRFAALVGTDLPGRLERHGITLDRGKIQKYTGLWIQCLDEARILLLGRQERLEAMRSGMDIPECPNDTLWRGARMLAGEVWIDTAVRGRFLPQMLNLMDNGAVSLKKGCFPGQEVIARSTHLGRIKRRLALLRCSEIPPWGQSMTLDGHILQPLDLISLSPHEHWLQAVAPSPLPPALSARCLSSCGPDEAIPFSSSGGNK